MRCDPNDRVGGPRRLFMRPLTKCTSRDKRSSFETTTEHFSRRAAFNLLKLRGHLETFSLRESGDGSPLGLDPKARAALIASAHAEVRDNADGFVANFLMGPLFARSVSRPRDIGAEGRQHQAAGLPRSRFCSERSAPTDDGVIYE
jgi:hypothetical protein